MSLPRLSHPSRSYPGYDQLRTEGMPGWGFPPDLSGDRPLVNESDDLYLGALGLGQLGMAAGRGVLGALARRKAGQVAAKEAAASAPLRPMSMAPAGPENQAGVGALLPLDERLQPWLRDVSAAPAPAPLPHTAPDLGALEPLPMAQYPSVINSPLPPIGSTLPYSQQVANKAARAKLGELGAAYHDLHSVRTATPRGPVDQATKQAGWRVSPSMLDEARGTLANTSLPDTMMTPSVIEEVGKYAPPPPMSESPMEKLLYDQMMAKANAAKGTTLVERGPK